MNYDNIEQLLDKYEKGICTAEETAIVESFLHEAEQEVIPGYDAFIEKEREFSASIQVESLIQPVTNMKDLLDRYAEGLCNVQQIAQVEAFLESAEQDMHPSYLAFVEQERLRQSELDVEEFVSHEDMGPLYNHFVEQERLRTCNIDVEALVAKLSQETEEKNEATIVPMRSSGARWKSLAGIAAVLVVVLTALVMMPQSSMSENDAYAVVNGVEIQDPEEAMSYALSILGKTGKEFQKGTSNMSHLKDLKHTSIYK